MVIRTDSKNLFKCYKVRKVHELLERYKMYACIRKNDHSEVKNYRLLDIVLTVCDLVEKLICRQMTNFWEKTNFSQKLKDGI